MNEKRKSHRRFEQVNLLADQVVQNLPTPTHGLLLLICWRHADVRCILRKSLNELATAAGISKRQAKRIVDDLVRVDALEVIRARQGTIPTVYRITGKPKPSVDAHVHTKAKASVVTHDR